MKHVGKMKNNDAPVIIVFRTLPGDPNSCLVIGTQGLGPSHHDDLMRVVESPEAQEAFELGTVLSVRRFSDNNTILPWLHQQGKMRKVATDTVLVTPEPNQSVGLDELNKIIAQQKGLSLEQLSIGADQTKAEVTEVATIADTPAKATVTPKTEVVADAPAANATPEDQAKFYRSQADKLSKQAADMRRKAEELSPTVKKAKTEKVTA
jgi:hypothetical protein